MTSVLRVHCIYYVQLRYENKKVFKVADILAWAPRIILFIFSKLVSLIMCAVTREECWRRNETCLYLQPK